MESMSKSDAEDCACWRLEGKHEGHVVDFYWLFRASLGNLLLCQERNVEVLKQVAGGEARVSR